MNKNILTRTAGTLIALLLTMVSANAGWLDTIKSKFGSTSSRPDTVYSLEEGCLARSSSDLQDDLRTAEKWSKSNCKLNDIITIKGERVPFPLSQIECNSTEMPFVYFYTKDGCTKNGGDPGRRISFSVPSEIAVSGGWHDPVTAPPFCKRKLSTEEWLRWNQQHIQTRGRTKQKGDCNIQVGKAKDGSNTLTLQGCFGVTALAFGSEGNCADMEALMAQQGR